MVECCLALELELRAAWDEDQVLSQFRAIHNTISKPLMLIFMTEVTYSTIIFHFVRCKCNTYACTFAKPWKRGNANVVLFYIKSC